MTVEAADIDQFHQHEVLHSAHIISSMFEDFVLGHPYTQSEPTIRAAADKIGTALADFYQLVGQKNLDCRSAS
jgi:hypothetical protein